MKLRNTAGLVLAIGLSAATVNNHKVYPEGVSDAHELYEHTPIELLPHGDYDTHDSEVMAFNKTVPSTAVLPEDGYEIVDMPGEIVYTDDTVLVKPDGMECIAQVKVENGIVTGVGLVSLASHMTDESKINGLEMYNGEFAHSGIEVGITDDHIQDLVGKESLDFVLGDLSHKACENYFAHMKENFPALIIATE